MSITSLCVWTAQMEGVQEEEMQEEGQLWGRPGLLWVDSQHLALESDQAPLARIELLGQQAKTWS